MYPSPLKTVIRQLNDNIAIVSCPFKRARILNFGARMSVFHYENQFIIWSGIPYGEEVEKALKLFDKDSTEFKVTYFIIPDVEHTMAAKSFKAKYPDLKIIAMEGVDLGKETPIDYVITSKMGNTIIGKEQLKNIGIADSVILDHFEFVYLPLHVNKDMVLYDKTSKILFEADVILNLGPKGTPLEQYSPELGFPKGYVSQGGLSFMTGYTHPDSKFYRGLVNKMTKTKELAGKTGIEAIYSWDFDTIVPCHGNVIEKDAKAYFKKFFAFLT